MTKKDVMADTSVWIAYFRGKHCPESDHLDSLLQQDRVTLCGVVEMELLRGVRVAERKRLSDLLAAVRFVETARADYIAAGEALGRLREEGVTVPATDALIAAVCRRNGLGLLTLDSHFQYLGGASLAVKDA